MNREAAHRMPPPTAPTPRAAWYALLAPPLAWAFQEWLGWYFGQRTCTSLTPASVRWIVLGVSVAALAVSLAGLLRGWGTWRDAADADHRERIDFLTFGGVLVSGVFTIAIVWAGFSTAFLSDCGVIR